MFFFFSSRRRHTRLVSDWSSDVCSSDLMIPEAVKFVKHFTDEGKPVASICHGPWSLVEADAVRGKKVTSWPSLKTDLRNAGANWVDKECVRDGQIVTSRKPDDIPAFNREMIQLFSERAQDKPLRKTA